ncbi:glycosyltransferase family 4 protein [Azospirillum sp.]|uniref:glycosyltransferase family 4 protein n=1 Tax=Azospirillum sp. TaxID=34012 RepID=UPI002D759F8E|nr:glycosyltransferase family 4 protein [Azospirillum sp.]HYD66547.1 glycosyltransferase family 4 protein [Azospirillum sp.]
MRILYVCHNDPRLHAGGTEIFARELMRAVARRPGVATFFIGGVDPLHRLRQAGTVFQTVDRGANDMLLWAGHFDPFFMQQADVFGVFTEFAEFLKEFEPDVVHFHHLLLIGVEAIALVRRLLPKARIVVTLHDYYPLCHHNGIMLKVPELDLCDRPTPGACARCFPDIPMNAFRLREINLKTHLSAVDRFVAPSRFLRDRYVAWGIDPDRVTVIRNGRALPPPVPPRALPSGGRRDAFAVFGNVSPFKGTRVAVEAARLLMESGETDFTLTIHGGLDFQADSFRQGFLDDVAAARRVVRHGGKYTADQVPRLIRDVDWVIIPSIWWENAPLVIQEAFHHGRPVLCGDIGGMAESVRDGVDGLHFARGNPDSLRAVLKRGLTEPGLWERLAGAIAPVVGIDECADGYWPLYTAS